MNTRHAVKNYDELANATDSFLGIFKHYLNIENNGNYKAALSFVDELMSDPETEEIERNQFMLNIVSEEIRRYESTLPELAAFSLKVENIPVELAVFRTLMEQYSLGGKDFPEIGTKGFISKILSGERNLTKQHIEKLTARFGISPALFFD